MMAYYYESKKNSDQGCFNAADYFSGLFESIKPIEHPSDMGLQTAIDFRSCEPIAQAYMIDVIPAFDIWIKWAISDETKPQLTYLLKAFREDMVHVSVMYSINRENVYDALFQPLLKPRDHHNGLSYEGLLKTLDTLFKLAEESHYYLFEISCCMFQIANFQFADEVEVREPFFTQTVYQAARYLNKFVLCDENYHVRKKEERIRAARSKGGQKGTGKYDKQYDDAVELLVKQVQSESHETTFADRNCVTVWLAEKLLPFKHEMKPAEKEEESKLDSRLDKWSNEKRSAMKILYDLLISPKKSK
ncbi:hypothetical protein [Dryocola sp. LX212]